MKNIIKRDFQYDGTTWVVGCCEHGDEQFHLIKIYDISRPAQKLLCYEEEIMEGGGVVSWFNVPKMCVHNVHTPHVTQQFAY
jgi:hypothetical protein